MALAVAVTSTSLPDASHVTRRVDGYTDARRSRRLLPTTTSEALPAHDTTEVYVPPWLRLGGTECALQDNGHQEL